MSARNDDRPTVDAADLSQHQVSEETVEEFTEGLFTTEDVTAMLRVKNNQILGPIAALVRIKAAAQRLEEYAAACHHAIETGHMNEAQCIATAIRHTVITMGTSGDDLDTGVSGAIAQQRAAA